MGIKFLFSKWMQKIQIPAIKNSKISRKAKICQRAVIYDSRIERYSYIGANTNVLNAEIGAFCSVSSDCEIGLGGHPLKFVSTSPVFYQKGNCLNTLFAEHPFQEYDRTVIGNDVWIGSGVKIKSGVRIGDGAIIGAGSVVTKDVAAYTIVAGVPAKKIRDRFEPETGEKIRNTEWWNWSDKEIQEAAGYFNDPVAFLQYAQKRKLQ